MKHRNLYILFLFAVLLLGSCTDADKNPVQPGQTVTREFAITVADMQTPDGAPVTRSDKTDSEKGVYTLYLVQFNGTDPTSKAVAASAITADADGKTNFAFATTTGTCRTYVVANFTPVVTVGTTTLAEFEKMGAAFEVSMERPPETLLPMSGYADFNLQTTTTIPTVTLTAMVAKLVVDYQVPPDILYVNILNATLKNVASSAAIGIPTDDATAQRPANVTFLDKENISPTAVYYVAENLAGQVSGIKSWTGRTLSTAPANAFYIELSGRTMDNKNTVTIASYIGDPRTPGDFNIRRNTEYHMNAIINDLSETDERIAIIPNYHNLNVRGKSANCYIVTGNEGGAGTYAFDYIKRGNNDTNIPGINYTTLPDLGTATEARVIWEQGSAKGAVVKSVKLYPKAGKVWFQTGTATEGNAVIGVFASSAADAPCLWSWHIWKLDGSAPANVACTKIPSPASASPDFNMMDRNLGAYNNTEGNVGSIGLLYQWGRKDPFPGPGGFNKSEPTNIYGSYNKGGTTGNWTGTYSIQTVTTDATNGTEKYAVQYPTAHILGTDPNGEDWYWGSRNDNLWGTPWVAAGSVDRYNGNQGTKSIYDPCPIGYRVPPQDTWNKQTGNGIFRNNGILLNSVASNFWFPAAGRRYSHNGGLDGSPSAGCYWSSSPDLSGSANGSNVIFGNSGDVLPRNHFYRAFCYSVRCVVE